MGDLRMAQQHIRKRVCPMRVPFLDLERGVAKLRSELHGAFSSVARSGRFILGPQVEAFEREFAAHIGVRHVVGCGCGTDAITLGLLAGGIGPGDEVVTTPNTAFPTIAAIVRTGATPRFCDVLDHSLLMDPDSLVRSISRRTRAVVPVHLYGGPAPMKEICRIARRNDLWVVEDCAQAHGASITGCSVGGWGHCGAFSFYPTKNLGALGDGGSIVTNSKEIAERLRRLRQYGLEPGYKVSAIGLCSRLDELQAALLRVRITQLSDDNQRRRAIWRRYQRELGNMVRIVDQTAFGDSAVHLAVIRVTARDEFRSRLMRCGVETAVHYPRPAHLQMCLKGKHPSRRAFPISERACEDVVSLPCYPELTDREATHVIESVRRAALSSPL